MKTLQSMLTCLKMQQENVTVRVDGEVIATVPVVNGTVSIALDNLTFRAQLLETSYSGDDNYGSVNNAKRIMVETNI